MLNIDPGGENDNENDSTMWTTVFLLSFFPSFLLSFIVYFLYGLIITGQYSFLKLIITSGG